MRAGRRPDQQSCRVRSRWSSLCGPIRHTDLLNRHLPDPIAQTSQKGAQGFAKRHMLPSALGLCGKGRKLHGTWRAAIGAVELVIERNDARRDSGLEKFLDQPLPSSLFLKVVYSSRLARDDLLRCWCLQTQTTEVALWYQFLQQHDPSHGPAARKIQDEAARQSQIAEFPRTIENGISGRYQYAEVVDQWIRLGFFRELGPKRISMSVVTTSRNGDSLSARSNPALTTTLIRMPLPSPLTNYRSGQAPSKPLEPAPQRPRCPLPRSRWECQLSVQEPCEALIIGRHRSSSIFAQYCIACPSD